MILQLGHASLEEKYQSCFWMKLTVTDIGFLSGYRLGYSPFQLPPVRRRGHFQSDDDPATQWI